MLSYYRLFNQRETVMRKHHWLVGLGLLGMVGLGNNAYAGFEKATFYFAVG